MIRQHPYTPHILSDRHQEVESSVTYIEEDSNHVDVFSFPLTNIGVFGLQNDSSTEGTPTDSPSATTPTVASNIPAQHTDKSDKSDRPWNRVIPTNRR